MGDDKCRTCKFFNENNQCIFSAPQALVVPMEMIQQKGIPQPVVLWPPVDPEGVCGQHQSKLTI